MKNSVRDNKENILDLYKNKHLSLREIGEKYGVSLECIRINLNKWGVNTSRGLKEGDKEDIIALYKTRSFTLKEIGDSFNVSAACILNNLRKWSVHSSISKGNKNQGELKVAQVGKVTRRLLGVKDSVIRMYGEDTKTLNEIGEAFGTSGTSIRRFLVGLGEYKGPGRGHGKSTGRPPKRLSSDNKFPFRVHLGSKSFKALNTADIVTGLLEHGVRTSIGNVIDSLTISKHSSILRHGFYVERIDYEVPAYTKPVNAPTTTIEEQLLSIFSKFEMPLVDFEHAVEKYYKDVYAPKKRKNEGLDKIKAIMEEAGISKSDISNQILKL